jgi:cytochrome c2
MRRPPVLLALLVPTALLAWRSEAATRDARAVAGGDPAKGRQAIEARGCGICHTIPGVPGAKGQVGPPLAGLASRAYLAGRLANTPDNLVRWIQAPSKVNPKTDMPDLGIGEAEARNIAAFLYTVRE